MTPAAKRRLKRARLQVASLRPRDARQERVKKNMSFSLELVEKWSRFPGPGPGRMAWKLWERFRASFEWPEDPEPPEAA